ncbi:hypothetical protein PV08_09254 [Exophiala spinifera]|uniref:SRP9 domain-containing protein n=1 Tax=Exophiala spinifera TaxID=91928 RepID=A0A0D2AZY4_9EURO|nr:uncharacterized protein PV08_09254 [Exophiala spinifera]KIW11980.1 hypothetical protein PV08_09254 [Exophiala spinifera]
MTYFSDLHTYLHQSSLLIQAYPTTRITTKYSLPRKPNPKSRSKSKQTEQEPTQAEGTNGTAPAQSQAKRDPSAVLTLKTFHPESGICLKYRTDKAAEVGRLLAGLGRLAKGEVIEIPSTTSAQIPATDGAVADKMDIDSVAGFAVPKPGDSTVAAPPAATQTTGAGAGGGGGGKGKKKKGKK